MSKEDPSPPKGQDVQARGAATEMDTHITGEAGLHPGATKENSVWDVYNNEAKKVDMELVKDWTSNLNSLLLFAAIFAAVLTAFVIESKKMLEQDPADVMVDVMIFFANNGANSTHPPYIQSSFEAPWSAVTINCLFFASLSTSLVAALASVVALQWVTNYDAAITRGGSSPEDRAKRRQFRYSGLLWWRMGGIIAGVPLLLYSSVALFFSGLAIWIWHIHHVVALVVVGGAAAAGVFYGGTTLLAVLSVSAPFRTPLSRAIYSLSHLPFSLVYFIIKAVQYFLIHLGRLILRESFNPIDDSFILWLKERHLSGIHVDKREDRTVEKEPKLGLDAIMWLANQLSISHVSFDRLLLLVTELPKWSKHISLRSRFDETSPWLSIFDLLAQTSFKKDPNDDITATELHIMSVLAEVYNIFKIRDSINRAARRAYQRENKNDDYWIKIPYRELRVGESYRIPIPIRIPDASPWCPNNLLLFLQDTTYSDYSPAALETAIRQSRWRNRYEDQAHWAEMFDLVQASPCSVSKESAITLSQYLEVATPGWWAGMAEYLMNGYSYEGPNMSSILEMQASVWHLMFDQKGLYRRARKDCLLPKYIQRIHEYVYRMPCSEHYELGGDLLLQMFDKVPLCKFPPSVDAFNSSPTEDCMFDGLLMLLALPYGYEDLASETLLQHMDQQDLDQALELLKAVKHSQVGSLALLLGVCIRLISMEHSDDVDIRPEVVVMMLQCINTALDLSSEQRSCLLIRPLVKRVQEIDVVMNYHFTEENEAASLAVVEAANRLKTHMAIMMVDGGRNCQLLSCSRTRGAHSPAIGWLPPYTD